MPGRVERRKRLLQLSLGPPSRGLALVESVLERSDTLPDPGGGVFDHDRPVAVDYRKVGGQRLRIEGHAGPDPCLGFAHRQEGEHERQQEGDPQGDLVAQPGEADVRGEIGIEVLELGHERLRPLRRVGVVQGQGWRVAR